MVRASAAEVVKLFGGTYPAGWDATSVGNLCTQMDAILDGKATPATFGTGTNDVVFANVCCYRWIRDLQKDLDDTSESQWWDREMQDWFDSLLTSTTHDSAVAIDGIADD